MIANLSLLFILLITIPRWAETLQHADSFAVWGLPLVAIGEGIMIEWSAYLLNVTLGRCTKATAEHHAKWEAHNERMRDQGKQNYKPEKDPSLRGYRMLGFWFVVLELVTLLAQTPHIMAKLTGQALTDVLQTNWFQWGYAVVLVGSPGIVTVALAQVNHFNTVLDKRGKGQPWFERVLQWASEQQDGLQQVRGVFMQRPEVAAPTVAMLTEQVENVSQRPTPDERRAMLVEMLEQEQPINRAALGREWGVSGTIVSRDLVKVKGNGHGSS